MSHQPVCAALGRHPAGVGAEGTERERGPQTQREERRTGGADFCGSAQDGAAPGTAKVKHTKTQD